MQQLEALLGPNMAKYANFALIFVGLLIAALVLLYILRKLLGPRLNLRDRSGARGRQPRLGVTEYFDLDRQGRRLVIVRRDNVEHLIMIGGPNDVLVESSIVRAERSATVRLDARDLAAPEPDAPAPVATPAPVQVKAPVAVALPAAKAVAAAPMVQPAAPKPLPAAPAVPQPQQPAAAARPVTPPAPLPPPMQPVQLPKPVAAPVAPPPPPPQLAPPRLETAAPGVPPKPAAISFEDQLSQMTAKLDEALRKPLQPAAPPAALPAAPPAAAAQQGAATAASAPASAPAAAPAAAQPPAKSAFDSLEEEMAKLLGRSKT